MKKLMRQAALLIAIGSFAVASANALTSSQVQDIKIAILSVPVPEMPAKAAELVGKAEQKDRQAVAATVVRAVVAKHRAAAPLVISAISKQSPDLAPAVAALASDLSNDQAPLIARAAAVAAPSQASAVSTAVSLAVPSRAGAVASSVSSATTGSSVLGGAAPSVAKVGVAAAARPNPAVGTRSSAANQNNSGVIIISDTPIAGGTFPATDPTPAPAPIVVYSQPPQ